MEQKFKVYNYRWVVLLVYVLHQCVNASAVDHLCAHYERGGCVL